MPPSLRQLPSIDRLLASGAGERLLASYRREYVTRQCRQLLDEWRSAIREGRSIDERDLTDDALLEQLGRRILAAREHRLVRVVNATGTVLHTNLGRAPLPCAAIEALNAVAGDAVNLEYDVAQGGRGRREDVIEELLRDLTGAEAATVVNNNAAAVLLALNTLASGKDVVVSRGELIEIGGAFRIPELMAKSGATLKEVGTTNRTHPADYENAIDRNTGLLLKVHTSNYRIVGFSSDVPLAMLVDIGRRHGVPVMEDLGSGALVDLSLYGLPKEPMVSESIALGVDVVTFSGDKVLGGPQSGMLAGTARWIREIARNPLHRALRCDKLTIAALEATLRLYRESTDIAADIPALRAFTRPLHDIDEMARLVLPPLGAALGPAFRLTIEDSTSQIGSGALPTDEIPTKVVAIRHDREDAEAIAERFRNAKPPIIGRIKDGAFLLDVRTIFNPDDLIPGGVRS
jgi:L-seryl-tRNA(Ser) seleniumtransferase